MLLALVFGLTAVLITVIAGAVYREAPSRVECPACGGPTSLVRPPLLLRRTQVVHWRWCAGCGWEGMARPGPEWIPGRPVAHDSGFHWGRERLPEDFGFMWRMPGPPAAAPPPHHPSGFRFAQDHEAQGDPGTPGPRAHPSGFRWRGSEAAPGEEPTGGFRWAEPGTDAEMRFRWAHREGRPSSGGFQWKDGA